MNIITITGMTCSGKSTLERDLCETFGYTPLRSMTTRQPRVGEINGIHYDFVTEQAFKDTPLIEHVQYGEHYYGLPATQLTDPLGTYVAVVEPIGRSQIHTFCSTHRINFVPVFLTVDRNMFAARFVDRLQREQKHEKFDWDTLAGRLAMVLAETTWEPTTRQLCFEYNATTKDNVLSSIERYLNTVNSR